MATYCFKCKLCGDTREADHPLALVAEECAACTVGCYVRDYRAEQTQLVIPDEFVNPLPADGPVL